MAARVFVERDGEGRLVVRKVASGDDDGCAEASWLRRAAGPGVAALVDHDPASATLTTAHAGSHTWRTARPGPESGARMAAGVLLVLDRLHRAGLVHGALGPDHVVVGGGGPVLCSPRPGGDDPSVDREAAADLLERCLERWADEGVAVPTRAAWQRAVDLLRRPGSGWTCADVAALLDVGATTPPAAPPAGASSDAAAGPRRWDGDTSTAGHQPAPEAGAPGRARRWPPRRTALGAVAVAGLAAVVTLGAPPWPPVPWGARPDGPPGPPPAAASDGRYRAEHLDGVLATTSQPCAGTPAGALLDPVSARVWTFVRLPGTGEQVPGAAAQRVPGATALEVRGDAGCQRIVAVGPAGEAAVAADAGPVRPG